ncbi:hypothetical protein H2203_001240 [Taxawa tesnikishii (nom. ined.)]|nr:hypothetical protein H2203_001240 [Dothideales sp. JES 119]
MTSVYTANTPPTSFSSLYDHLKTFPTPLLPPGHSYDPKLTDTIASLYLHPTIESLLHILNHDLPSAHFLARKMESAPAYEGMYIHGILHRVEGDYNNCLAWYADVCCSEAFEEVWGPSPDREFEKGDRKIDGRKQPAQESARAFIAAVRTFKEGGGGQRSAGAGEPAGVGDCDGPVREEVRDGEV